MRTDLIDMTGSDEIYQVFITQSVKILTIFLESTKRVFGMRRD